MIVVIGGEKGGTGKTTLATNLAAMRVLRGHDALLVDTDLQGSSNYWASNRDDDGTAPRVPCIQKTGRGLQSELQDLASRYEDIIIDAGGRDSPELRVGLVVAEKAFIPIQASQFDIWTLDPMSKLIGQAEGLNGGLKAYVVINRASTNPSVSETEEARGILEDFENLTLSSAVIRERITYRKAARSGLGVVEMQPVDRKAAEEIELLYKEVFDE